jgi:L-alanine-DL-glutamate epimerase-like enolase superfamily enzyme
MDRITQIDVSAFTIATDFPEADGTIEWDSTTIVLVEAFAGGHTGIGFTYGDRSAASIIDRFLSPIVLGRDAMAVPGTWAAMLRGVRNMGRPGIASHAIAAVDMALWDLKARILGVSLLTLLGPIRSDIPVYASGGFTSYSNEQLELQLRSWVEFGFKKVKMKVGSKPAEDLARVRIAREAIGPRVELFVDANGAYTRKQALAFAEQFAEFNVRWFEEPVSSDDLEGLRFLRDRAPSCMTIAAGEYGYDSTYFRRLLEAGAADILQVDATRCAGVTGFLEAAALAEAHHTPLSSHTAPAIHGHLCCAVPAARNIEYFHDHARIERMLFDGAVEPVNGVFFPDTSRPGIGLEFKRRDAERFAA